MTHQIRLATINDCRDINAVSKILGYNALSNSECEDKLGRLIRSATDKVYVAINEARVIGWLHLFEARRLASPDFYEIGGLVVDPGWSNNGVGRSLVEYASSCCNGTLRVRCNAERQDTLRFYEATGLARIKTQHVFELVN